MKKLIDKFHWQERKLGNFTKNQRKYTTVLHGGFAILHDKFIAAAISSLGYNFVALDCPDNESLRVGKEFGNRGQCSPTYYTVGNLIKYLVHLRDDLGISIQEILDNYVFYTATGCETCRFGMYSTEYRKALRDAGFDGFRVLTIHRNDGFESITADGGKENIHGIEFSFSFFTSLLISIVIGDIFNILAHRIRPYEITKGDTDNVIKKCQELVIDAFASKSKITFLKALYNCRRLFAGIKVDYSIIKPKVMIIGEFWAMTTDGDGNYNMKSFLEKEGAECIIVPLTVSILRYIWDAKYSSYCYKESIKFKQIKTNWSLSAFLSFDGANLYIKSLFYLCAYIVGLKNYLLTDFNKLAQIGKKYFHLEIEAGEAHLEVAKVIQAFTENKAHMVISVKPFGCMPSSGISDGVQSLVTSKLPNAIFLPIETSGDGEANVYSRAQMSLYKAKEAAEKEFEEAKKSNTVINKISKALNYPIYKYAGTAANFIFKQ